MALRSRYTDVLRQWKRAIQERAKVNEILFFFIHRFMYSSLKCWDWIERTMLTLNKVVLFWFFPFLFHSVRVSNRSFSIYGRTHALSVWGKQNCSCVLWLAALLKHIHQCLPPLPSTPWWCPTRTSVNFVYQPNENNQHQNDGETRRKFPSSSALFQRLQIKETQYQVTILLICTILKKKRKKVCAHKLTRCNI